MRLIRFADSEGRIRTGVKRNGIIQEVSPQEFQIAGDAFESVLSRVTDSQKDIASIIDSLEDKSVFEIGEINVLPPVSSNGRLFALGGAYTQHVQERGQPLNSVPSQWLVPGTAVIGPDDSIIVPDRVRDRTVPAVELGVVIGKDGRYIDERDALSHVAGYTIVNDVTARGDWPGPMAYKLMDTFSPCGPQVVTSDEFGSVMDRKMTIDHGGERICEGTTASMRFTIPFVISYISSIVKLQPGDIISTGDPGRVQGELQDGKTVTVSIEGIGSLSNPVRFEG